MYQSLNKVNRIKKSMFIVLFIIISNIVSSQEIPKIVNYTIIFNNGSTLIQMNDNDCYLIFPKSNRLVYIKIERIPNVTLYMLKFFDFQGNKIGETDEIVGAMQFVYCEISERLLVGQIGPYGLDESYLFDLDGNLIKKINYEYFHGAKQVGITEDNAYFWFAYERIRPLNPGETPRQPWRRLYEWNQIMIFEVITGNLVAEFATQDYPFNFSFNDINYTIPVSSPGSAP